MVLEILHAYAWVSVFLSFPFIVVVAVAFDLSLRVTQSMTGASVPSWYKHANWDPREEKELGLGQDIAIQGQS